MKQTTVRLVLALSAALVAVQLNAATFITKFNTDPLASGWQAYGNTNLFTWDSTNENLHVTWDSSQPNSYFYQPLGATLTRTNGFMLAFDLTINDVPDTNGFQLALGFLKFSDATSPGFFRGSGFESPNIAEFDFFPDSGFGASLNGTMADASSTFTFAYVNQPMNYGTTYRVILTHAPGAQILNGQVLTNGQLYATFPFSYISTGFNNFELDTVAVCSYSDVNGWGSSILAHGIVDNFIVAAPLPVGTLNLLAPGEVSFASDTNWVYTLESSSNLVNWSAAAPTTPGNGTNLVLQATSAPTDNAFYRVRADLP